MASPGWKAVLDDGLARRCARTLDIPLIGTLGIIIRARQTGLIAAAVVGELGRRVSKLEQRASPGQLVTDEQAAEIAQQVKALAGLLTEHDPGKNHYQSVFNELYRRFGVTSYKLVPQAKYPAVLAFLEEWRGKTAA